MLNIFRGSVLAGICISIGCVVNLQTGGVAGAVLFAFGLLACVHFKLPLYTGTAGFVMNRAELWRLLLILLGNLVGCFLMGLAMRYSLEHLPDLAAKITIKRTDYSIGQCLLLSAMCGFIMTTAVKFAREKSYLPLLFGVPVFILCGFIHSIADAFYLCASPTSTLLAKTLVNYLFIILGNFIGCNLYRLIFWKLEYNA